jgi:uncharacterized protein|tara:strand:+ start:890 stop:1528 length:639 start_codon:yes stop_codon:yes gene_type:complete
MEKKDLPNNIAIFPLSNAIFFPKTVLPLNIFEDRYIQLVNDCMKEKKMFGMIQPKNRSSKKPEVYQVGCLGKIVNFHETEDKRFIINLSGIIRFKIKKELGSEKLYRKFNVDYSEFMHDLDVKKEKEKSEERNKLLKNIKYFFEKIEYSIEFNELEKLNFNQLIDTICMISPFSIEEKQKLIEANQTEEKFKVLNKIIEFNLFDFFQNKTIQ